MKTKTPKLFEFTKDVPSLPWPIPDIIPTGPVTITSETWAAEQADYKKRLYAMLKEWKPN